MRFRSDTKGTKTTKPSKPIMSRTSSAKRSRPAWSPLAAGGAEPPEACSCFTSNVAGPNFIPESRISS